MHRIYNFDKSITLWKGCLSFNQYIPPKAAKLGIKTFKLCESSRGYLWNFFVHTGAGSDITTGTDVPDNLQSSKIVVRLVVPLVKLDYMLCMANYYNSLSLCSLFRGNGMNVAGKLHLNRKRPPPHKI
jgi:hypothetical protein